MTGEKKGKKNQNKTTEMEQHFHGCCTNTHPSCKMLLFQPITKVNVTHTQPCACVRVHACVHHRCLEAEHTTHAIISLHATTSEAHRRRLRINMIIDSSKNTLFRLEQPCSGSDGISPLSDFFFFFFQLAFKLTYATKAPQKPTRTSGLLQMKSPYRKDLSQHSSDSHGSAHCSGPSIKTA